MSSLALRRGSLAGPGRLNEVGGGAGATRRTTRAGASPASITVAIIVVRWNYLRRYTRRWTYDGGPVSSPAPIRPNLGASTTPRQSGTSGDL